MCSKTFVKKQEVVGLLHSFGDPYAQEEIDQETFSSR
jgi:hypothetical protein